MKTSVAAMKHRAASLLRQKGAWSWIARYGALFAVFLLFFMPAYARLSDSGSKASALKREIADIKKLSVSLLTPAESETMRERVKQFESRLTDAGRGTELLDLITEEAEKQRLQVIQIYSDNPVLLRDESGADLELDGKKLSLLPVSFRLEADARTLAAFLHSLSQRPQALFLVESMHLQRTPERVDTLQCDIVLSFVLK